MSEPLIVDLKIQILPEGIPKPLMEWLIANSPKAQHEGRPASQNTVGGLENMIRLCNQLGLKVTVTVEQPGGSA